MSLKCASATCSTVLEKQGLRSEVSIFFLKVCSYILAQSCCFLYNLECSSFYANTLSICVFSALTLRHFLTVYLMEVHLILLKRKGQVISSPVFGQRPFPMPVKNLSNSKSGATETPRMVTRGTNWALHPLVSFSSQ